MESGDERDDDAAFRPLLPPDDRLWRHPSELHPLTAVATAVASDRRSHSRMWAIALLAGAIGAILTAGVGYAAGGLRARTVSVPAVESDLLSPGVTLASTIGRSGVVAGSGRVRPSCVVLVAHDAHDTRIALGVIVRSDGIVLTSAHLVTGAQSVTATVGGTRRVGAKVVARDPASDLAVLKLDGKDYNAALLGSALDLRVADPVMLLHPPGEGNMPGDPAEIGAMGQETEGPTGGRLADLLEIDTAQPATRLGGPVLDSRGAVIGIVSAFGPAGEAVEYATPIDLARSVEQQLLQGARVVPVWLGVEGTDLPADQAKALGVAGGAVVSEVTSGSPAQVAGLRPGDVVVGVDGRVVASMDNLVMALHARPPGTEVELEVRRDGVDRVVTARLAPRPLGS